MPNRTIYLPDDLDGLSRRLGLNLSQLAQEAIARHIEENPEAADEARIEAAIARIAKLDMEWPEDELAKSRAEAGER